jgi:hypothetical protein
MLRSTPAQTPSRTVEWSRCHRALGLLCDDHLIFVSHVNESLRASTAEARPDTCCTDFTEAPAGVSFLMTLWSSYRQKTDPNICPLGPGTATAAEHPPWAGRSRGQPVNSDRGGAVEQPGRAPETSWPRASPAIACLFTPTRIRDSPVLIWDWPTASRSFFNRHDGSRIGSVVPSSTARAEFTTPMQNASYERRLELLGRRASALPKCSLRQSVVVTPISSVPEMGQLAHPS